MPFWFPFGTTPEASWVYRVLSDLSALHDAGAFDDEYFRRAWLTMMLISVGDDPMLSDPRLQEEIVDWLVKRSGTGEGSQEASSAENVFGMVKLAGSRSSVEEIKEEPHIVHLVPGFAIAGRRWRFHLTDKDSNRPAPHGHDVDDHSIVLDPYTGVVVDGNGKELKAAKPKELRPLWKDKTFRNFADRARQTLREQQPWRAGALPPVPDV